MKGRKCWVVVAAGAAVVLVVGGILGWRLVHRGGEGALRRSLRELPRQHPHDH